MDARSEKNAIPLAVDLDGTLIATDLLWEGLFLLLRRNPLYLFMVPVWLLSGPARLKQEIAARIDIDPAGLPYREALVERLREERAAGRRIVLATGTPRKFAEAIAAHLGVFDAGHGDRRPPQFHRRAANAPRWSRPMATAASTMPATAATTSGASTPRARRSSLRPTAMPRAGRPRTAPNCSRRRSRRFKTYLKMLRAHQWAEERADRRADGAVARIFQHRHARGLPARLRLVQRGGLGDLHPQRLLRPGARPQASDQAQAAFRQRRAVDPVRLGGDRRCCWRSASPPRAFLPPLFLGGARRLSGHHDGLFAVGQAHAADRRADAGRPLHDAHPGGRRRDRHRRLVLAARLLRSSSSCRWRW